jgi:PTH1 family peptidyl-tRNA hydrolase
MSYIVVGLGNPGEEYKGTRHNVGRDFVEASSDKIEAALGKNFGKKIKSVVSKFFMNESGKAIKPLVKSIKAAEKLIVVHDDLDLPLGTLKISFNRGSGGHRGVESVAKAVKTKAFVRIRVGVASSTPSGKIKKPKGEDAVIKFILGKFSPSEQKEISKVYKKTAEAVQLIVEDGREAAMSKFN